MIPTEVQALSTEDIIAINVRALFRRFHLARDYIIGLIGDRGSGKSLGAANIALRDFMMSGEPCWSNMQVGIQIEVDDEIAAHYGSKGGVVSYAAGLVDKQSFLALDSRYKGGVLLFDEFNLEYGEARRSAANVNLMTDRAIQQLRKLQCGLIYTVLDEMYVDRRIRENTDIFIRCSDIAFKPGNMANHMQQGHIFEWRIYWMSDKAAGIGNTYRDTKSPDGPYQIYLKDTWGAIDTMERQAAGRLSYSDKQTLLKVDIKEDPKDIEAKSRWGWLDDRLRLFFDNHSTDGPEIEILSSEFRKELGVNSLQWGSVVRQIYLKIPNMDSMGSGSRSNPTRFIIPNRELATI